MWRWLPDWSRDDTAVYRFDYAVEAEPSRCAVRRRSSSANS